MGEELALNCDFETAKQEMHILAYVYRWDRNTLWSLPRNERKLWVEEVIRQKKAEKDAMNSSHN